MNPQPQLFLVGMSWRTAPVDVRGRFAVPASELARRLDAIGAIEGVKERFVLSTCNRMEVLVAAAPDAGLEQALCDLLFGGAEPRHLYVHRGVRAVIHVFRVASGLDSLVLGETEILGQVKDGMALARERGALGKVLDPLLRQALSVGKRVRNDTRVGEGTLSVARVGVAIAERAYGGFEQMKALVVGAGDTARLVGTNLAGGGVGSLLFANRTVENARALTAEVGGEATGLERLPELALTADVVFTCLDGVPDLLRATDLEGRELRRRDRPLLVVDLSVPRAVEAAVAQLDNVLYYDLDDVRRVVDENQEERLRASRESSEILVSEVHKFVSLRTYAAFSPVISELRRRFHEISDEVLDDVAGETATPEMMRLAHELTRRLLDVSLGQLKEGARHASPADALGHEYRQFLDNL